MPSRDRLTAKQRRLLRELDQLIELLHLDYASIRQYQRSIRTIKLEWTIRWLARAAVVESYTYIDELLADQICWFYFGRSRPFWQLWKSKRFRIFNHHILQDMYLLEKLRLIRGFRKLPHKVVADIHELNALRNGMAHAFFPENLKKAKPIWKGKDIFCLETLRLFEKDMHELRNFFFEGERTYRRQGRIVRLRRRPQADEQAAQ
jgi:hypothetical protein